LLPTSFALRRALGQLQPEKPHATEFARTLDALNITPRRVGELFNAGGRSVRRWQDGTRRVPYGVAILFRLIAAGVVTISQVEQAAIPIPARTHGSAKPRPPTPLLVEPAPKQSALARAQAATPAGPGLTTAEKVYALTPEACRWPCGDPGHPDFRFCGRPVAKRPYCEQHRALGYIASLKSRSPSYGSSRSAQRVPALSNIAIRPDSDPERLDCRGGAHAAPPQRTFQLRYRGIGFLRREKA
jgi:GcrA cell cycle regulator